MLKITQNTDDINICCYPLILTHYIRTGHITWDHNN